jgi:Fe-S cluster assembly protein SufD
MQEKPRVVVSKQRRSGSSPKEIAFTLSDLPLLNNDLNDYRKNAWKTYQALPFPQTTDEAWRRTDLHLLPLSELKLPVAEAYQDLPDVPDDLLNPLVGDQNGGQVTLLPGGSRITMNNDLLKLGVVFTDFKSAFKDHAGLVVQLIGQIVKPGDGKFAALSSAFMQNGILLYVPKNVRVEQPLHSIFWGPGTGLAHFSHLLVFLDDGASVTYLHESASPDENGHSMHSGIVEIHVGKNAELKFVELQSWGRGIWNFSHERARVEQGGRIDWIFGAIGSRLTKNFSDLDLVGEGSQGRMSGFYFTDGSQHLDHDTQQNHFAPHTTSDLLFKGALKGKSRSVWQGMIYVAPGAQKTDGYQANRNIILSDGARADSIPGLEILADDVRCTHGATVGKLEQEPLFYLKSRGIPQPEAERLIVEGFFDPIMQRIPFEGVRARFQQAIERKMA